MKTNHLTSIIAAGALLPLAAWAGDDSGTKNSIQREAYDPRPSETRSGSPTPRIDDARDQTATRSRTESDTNASHVTSHHGSSAGIERIDAKELEQRATASDIIGSKVVDREGQDLGKVKDIGLAAVAPQLSAQNEDAVSARDRAGLSSRPEANSASDMSVSAYPGSPSPGLRPNTGNPAMHNNNEDPYLAEQRLRREVERAGTAGTRDDVAVSTSRADATRDRDWNRNPTTDGTAATARIFVQPDRSLGLKGDLVAIPSDRVHREGDTLRVDLSRDELRAIVLQQDASRVSMNR